MKKKVKEVKKEDPEELAEVEVSVYDLEQIESENTAATREFAECLEDLRNAEGLKIYADTYTKLYDYYYLMKDQYEVKCEEIKQIQERATTFDDHVADLRSDISNRDETIKQQIEAIAEAKKLCDAMHQRELAAVESLGALRAQLYKVEKELEFRKRKGEDDDIGAQSAAKEKEKLEKEVARLNIEIDGFKERLQNLMEYQEELERKNSKADLTIGNMEQQIEDAQTEKIRTGRLVDYINAENAKHIREIEERGKTISEHIVKIQGMEKSLARRDKTIQRLKDHMEELEKELESAKTKLTQLQDQVKANNVLIESMKEELHKTTKDLKSARDDNTRVRNELVKVNKLYQTQIKKTQLMEQKKASAEQERAILQQQIGVMDREVQSSKRQAEADRREIENLQRATETYQKAIQKMQLEASENVALLQAQEQQKVKLQQEIDQALAQLSKQRLTIRSLEKEKDRILEEAVALNEKIDDLSEEVSQRTGELLNANKVVRSMETRIKSLQVNLDMARTERNQLHNNYSEALDQIQDLAQKLKMAMYQVEQQKEDVVEKERRLRACEASLSKANKKAEALRVEVLTCNYKVTDLRAEVAGLRQEEANLTRALQDGDSLRNKLGKEMESLVSERDIIGAQLVRRNDEVAFLYEKIRILEGTMQRGEKQYEQRLDDIRLLRVEIIRLRKEKNLLCKGIENTTDLRLEVFNLERELGKSRLRSRALEEALETPLNVHRWRKLEATDPEKVTLMKKLTLLQRKVLTQGESIAEKERKLKETMNLYNAVKVTLEVQPGPQLQEQLLFCQKALAKRTSKMRCLVAELSMRESQMNEFRTNLEIALGELNETRQRYQELNRGKQGDGDTTPITKSASGFLPQIVCGCGESRQCICGRK